MQTLERIRLLGEETIAQIAAGEVIERPASVVKELVENSLDAGASWIMVELRNGGRCEIVVRDDGCGILHEDLPLALARHGTSKLGAASELFSVRTLGFRGEGLASIAAASKATEIVSRPRGAEFGSRVVFRGGVTSPVERAAASMGTTVAVRELFAATPVRQEFLASDKSEFSRVSAFLSRLALGWPRVAFALRHDGREVWSLPAVSSPVDRLEMVFGRGSRGSLTPVSTSPNIMIGIGGFTSRIGADRPNRQGQVLFVNGRMIRNPALTAAWSSGYSGKIGASRYPFGVLMLSLPPGDVDVNVHPTKIEVRFANAATVFDVVRRAVEDALGERAQPATPTDLSAAASKPGALPTPQASLLWGVGEQAVWRDNEPSAQALGQIDQTFIVIRDAHELLVVDQHAAHERIAFECLEAGWGSPESGTPLLLPRVVELTPDQIETLEACREELCLMGVATEPFGEGAYRINAVPSGYGGKHFDLADMLDDLTSQKSSSSGGNGTNPVTAQRKQHILASAACHSVVRAHEPLGAQEQLELYHRLRACREPQTCPHGRPTMLRFDAQTLAKAFKRT